MILMNTTIQKDLNPKIKNMIPEMNLIMKAKLNNNKDEDKIILKSKILFIFYYIIIL